jgi:hypothetical protein
MERVLSCEEREEEEEEAFNKREFTAPVTLVKEEKT